MKIGIVGWGLEAQSAYKFFGAEHEYLIVNESAQDNFPAQSDKVKIKYLDTDAPVGIPGQVAELSYLEGIEACDKIIYQPTAIFNLQKVYGDNPDFWSKATTVYDIFFENCPTKNIIGVTGTKGKGTTSTMIARMLEANGKSVHLGGNIGTPILDLLPDIKPDDWVVWELANFQLKPATHSPHIAVILMITEEHLDWHPNMEDYVAAKANIVIHQNPDDISIYYADNEISQRVGLMSAGTKVPFCRPPGAWIRDGSVVIGDTEIIKKSDIKLLGDHNLQNICAAVTAFWQVSQDPEVARSVIANFSGLEHRLEFVAEIDNVKYYNDSFGTTPETTLTALDSFTQPVVLIVGGHDKGADYEKLGRDIAQRNVKHAVVIGLIADKILQGLHSSGYQRVTSGLDNMTDIVARARELAAPGDVVLLSAGTSSFGMFKDYKERGDKFKAAVAALNAAV